MIFANRAEAGRSLAWRLAKYTDSPGVVVLGIPRGGVPVAFEVAKALHAPMDLFLIRKLGVPGHEELAFGAIATGGVRVLDRNTMRMLAISAEDVEEVTDREKRELQRRELAYRGDAQLIALKGTIVILVDDGIATGASLTAGIRALREHGPAKIVVAVPVAPSTSAERISIEADEFICVALPEQFRAVGEFYDDFSQVRDEEVIELLARSRRREVSNAA